MQKHSVVDQLIPSKSYKNPRHTDRKRKEIENEGKTIRGLQHWETEEAGLAGCKAARWKSVQGQEIQYALSFSIVL